MRLPLLMILSYSDKVLLEIEVRNFEGISMYMWGGQVTSLVYMFQTGQLFILEMGLYGFG